MTPDPRTGDRVQLVANGYWDSPIPVGAQGWVTKLGFGWKGHFVDVLWEGLGQYAIWPSMGDVIAVVSRTEAVA